MFRKVITAVVLALTVTLGAVAAQAATFTIDPGNVTISGTDFCFPADCTLQGAVTGGSFDLNNVGDSASLSNLFDWDIVISGLGARFTSGAGIYDVAVDLAFSAPMPAIATANGAAGFVTLLGQVSGGVLTWANATGVVAFGKDSYVLNYTLWDVVTGGFGTSTSSGATFALAQAPSTVPLPASALLLLGSLGGLGLLRRRRKS
jgi:hypothetical protein